MTAKTNELYFNFIQQKGISCNSDIVSDYVMTSQELNTHSFIHTSWMGKKTIFISQKIKIENKSRRHAWNLIVYS